MRALGPHHCKIHPLITNHTTLSQEVASLRNWTKNLFMDKGQTRRQLESQVVFFVFDVILSLSDISCRVYNMSCDQFTVQFVCLYTVEHFLDFYACSAGHYFKGETKKKLKLITLWNGSENGSMIFFSWLELNVKKKSCDCIMKYLPSKLFWNQHVFLLSPLVIDPNVGGDMST